MGTRAARALAGAVLTAMLASVALAHAVGQAPRGLWETDFSGHQTRADCDGWDLDGNNFCFANEGRNGLEIGVKFRASSTVQITGVRVYRVDPATVTASLWDAAGTLLARGTFADSDVHRWQDMSFAQPVTISPGRTYVASYYTPGTKYAFEHYYFQNTGRTVGPISALRSVEGDPNGVHCYDDAPCGSFPIRPYKDSAYFVTPLWVQDGTTNPPTKPPTATPAPTPTPTPTHTPTHTPTSTSTPTSTDPPTDGDGGPDSSAPRVASFRPHPGARRVRVGAKVTVGFAEPVRAASLTSSTIRLRRAGSNKPVRAVLRYDATRSKVVIDPRRRLRARTTYHLVVTSGVLDLDGNPLDQAPARAGRQDATTTFRTR